MGTVLFDRALLEGDVMNEIMLKKGGFFSI